MLSGIFIDDCMLKYILILRCASLSILDILFAFSACSSCKLVL